MAHIVECGWRLRLEASLEKKAARALHLPYVVYCGPPEVYVIEEYTCQADAEKALRAIREWIQDDSRKREAENRKIRREQTRIRARRNKERMFEQGLGEEPEE